jgi:protein-tyrosine phosphatase
MMRPVSMSPKSNETSRELALEGCFNVRDLGGLLATDGSEVRWRMLFRADGLHRLSPAGTALLHELGVTTVIDLRTAEELETRGRVPEIPSMAAYHHLPLFDMLPDASVMEEWEDPLALGRHYADLAEQGAPAIAQALSILSGAAAYPVVFHCAAGKDRTGVLAALVLGLLGVPDDQIADDYAASGPGMRRMLHWLQETYPDGRDEIERRAAAIVACEPEAMHEFLSVLRDRYGSVEGFAAAIGLRGAAGDLRAVLLRPPLAA